VGVLSDLARYDNCYSTSQTVMVDGSSKEAQSATRFQNMANVLDSVDRDIQYFVCQWGIGTNVGVWASAIGNTWRISNDIYNAWRSIWRITNQVVPYYKHTKAGAFADMDMLIVGLDALSVEEERFHFGMWAINKSPLIIGAVLNSLSLSSASVDILSNKEVIAINQDSLAKQAQLVQRFTEEEWDVWLGNLSDNRKILGVANWKNDSQTVAVNLASFGIASATARDVWRATDIGSVDGVQNTTLAGHELKLWVLSDITTTSLKPVGYYSVANATLGGTARLVSCADQECAPTSQKVTNITADASVIFQAVNAEASGRKLVGVDFINYDYAFQTAWDLGSNILNMTIAVNGGKMKRWAFPLSGGDWWESERLLIELDGFVAGRNNSVEFRSHAADIRAPDLVGFEIFE
jgi:alpha-galactosidase